MSNENCNRKPGSFGSAVERATISLVLQNQELRDKLESSREHDRYVFGKLNAERGQNRRLQQKIKDLESTVRCSEEQLRVMRELFRETARAEMEKVLARPVETEKPIIIKD